MSSRTPLRWLRVAVLEMYGLFVDDAVFAIAIVLWLGIVWTVTRLERSPNFWSAPLLFAGLAVLLMTSAIRYARNKRG